MRQHLRACVVGSGVAALSLMLVAPSVAQGRVRGQVTDEYDNPIPGATIAAEGSGAPSTTTTDDNGRFQFLGLSGEYTFTATAPGYVGIRPTAAIRRLLRTHRAGLRDHTEILWATLSLQRFLERWA